MTTRPLRPRRARRDANEPAIVAALEAAGCTVAKLAEAGLPDLLVGYCGKNLLLEVKHRHNPKDLTGAQIDWHFGWKGQVCIVTSETEALEAVGVLSRSVSTRAR